MTEGHKDHMGFVGVCTWKSGFSAPLKALELSLPLLEPGSLILPKKRAENPEVSVAMGVGWGGLFTRWDLSSEDPASGTKLGPSPAVP